MNFEICHISEANEKRSIAVSSARLTSTRRLLLIEKQEILSVNESRSDWSVEEIEASKNGVSDATAMATRRALQIADLFWKEGR